MITINLLPYREKAKKANVERQIAIIAASFVLLIVLLVSVHMLLLASIRSLDTETKESEKRLADLTKIIGEIETIKAEKKVLEKKLAVIGGLEKDRTYPVRMLDDVSSQVPTKDIWLEKVAEAGGQLTVEGKARDNFAVVRFMKNLEGSMYIGSVELISSKQVDLSGIKLQQFALSCGLRKDF